MNFYKDSKDGYYALQDSTFPWPGLIAITKEEYDLFNPVLPESPNPAILAALAEADLKIIRALVENDVPRIEAHKASQAALRLQLKSQ